MRVQRLIVPGTGDPSFTVVGSDGLPIGPIESFLSLLSSLERSPNTVRAYAHDLKLFFEFLNEVAVEWSDVELDDVVNFVAWLRNANGDNVVALRPVRARGPSTINRALVTVERFYDYQGRAGRSHALGSALRDGGKRVAKQGFLAHVARDGRRNSFLRLPQPRMRPKTLEPEQVCALLAACTNLRDLLLLALLYDTGMRVGAALGLRHSDVDPRRGVVRIIDRPDNSNGARTKGSNGDVCASEEWFRLYHRYMHEVYGDLDCDYVFVNLWRKPIGRPMSYNGVRELVRSLRQRTGITFVPHMLRHTHATELQRHKVPLEIISKRLLHRQLQPPATSTSISRRTTCGRHWKAQASGSKRNCIDRSAAPCGQRRRGRRLAESAAPCGAA